MFCAWEAPAAKSSRMAIQHGDVLANSMLIAMRILWQQFSRKNYAAARVDLFWPTGVRVRFPTAADFLCFLQRASVFSFAATSVAAIQAPASFSYAKRQP